MIFDTIENYKQYAGINKGIDDVLTYAKGVTSQNYPKDKLYLDGDNVFLIFADYETHSLEEAKTEAHRKYIDVMYMVDGEELIYVKPTDHLKNITMPFDAEKDALLADTDSDTTPVLLKSGSFVVLFPQDAHAPACDVNNSRNKVKKIIGKVLIG